MSPYHGCLCIVDYDDVDRNCSGAYLFKYQTALAYPHVYAIVQAISNSLNESSSEYESDDGLISAGGTDNTFGLYKKASGAYYTSVRGNNKSVRNNVSIGESFFRDGNLVIKDLRIKQENGKAHESTTVSQLLVFISEDGKDLDEFTKKIFEIRIEHSIDKFDFFGEVNSETLKIKETSELSVLDFSLDEIVIPLHGIDVNLIEIRTLTNTLPIESKRMKNAIEYNVFPNPSDQNGFINIKNPNRHNTNKVELYDNNGNIVFSQEYNSTDNSFIFKPAKQKPGVYHILIHSEGIIQRKRLLIQE